MKGYETSESDLVVDLTMRERPETPLQSLIFRKEKIGNQPIVATADDEEFLLRLLGCCRIRSAHIRRVAEHW
jgi:hypothetical protein